MKTEKKDILMFIDERSKEGFGTTKKAIYKAFTKYSKDVIDKCIKELRYENEIMLSPLVNESTGMFAGRGYVTENVF
ncbi:hypothetical protein [uncultured Bacteroides sp.]|uniref:hypothetical protein n=1 Tax=uncultured Bacteroides sp. TaxID=162156 RepID=UPI002AAC3B0C|nr:hypothetical protein [uncultured Bacteroides sp.]